MAQAAALKPYRKRRPEGKITFEEFLDWAGEDTNSEFVDGKISRSFYRTTMTSIIARL